MAGLFALKSKQFSKYLIMINKIITQLQNRVHISDIAWFCSHCKYKYGEIAISNKMVWTRGWYQCNNPLQKCFNMHGICCFSLGLNWINNWKCFLVLVNLAFNQMKKKPHQLSNTLILRPHIKHRRARFGLNLTFPLYNAFFKKWR